jgi:hypothetical protein
MIRRESGFVISNLQSFLGEKALVLSHQVGRPAVIAGSAKHIHGIILREFPFYLLACHGSSLGSLTRLSLPSKKTLPHSEVAIGLEARYQTPRYGVGLWSPILEVGKMSAEFPRGGKAELIFAALDKRLSVAYQLLQESGRLLIADDVQTIRTQRLSSTGAVPADG